VGAFHPEPIQPLGPEECWALLEGVPVGRLVVGAHAASLDPHPWLDTPKAHLIRLDVEEITGRRFTLNDAARAAQAGG